MCVAVLWAISWRSYLFEYFGQGYNETRSRIHYWLKFTMWIISSIIICPYIFYSHHHRSVVLHVMISEIVFGWMSLYHEEKGVNGFRKKRTPAHSHRIAFPMFPFHRIIAEQSNEMHFVWGKNLGFVGVQDLLYITYISYVHVHVHKDAVGVGRVRCRCQTDFWSFFLIFLQKKVYRPVMSGVVYR